MPSSPNQASGVYSTDIRTNVFDKYLGEKLTYSFYAKADAPRTITFEAGGITKTTIELTTEWQRFSGYIEKAESKAPTFYCGTSLSTTPYYIKDIMLTTGDTLYEYEPY